MCRQREMEEGGKRSQDLRASLCWALCRRDTRPCSPGLPALTSVLQLLSDALGAQPFIQLLVKCCSGENSSYRSWSHSLRALNSMCLLVGHRPG